MAVGGILSDTAEVAHRVLESPSNSAAEVTVWGQFSERMKVILEDTLN